MKIDVIHKKKSDINKVDFSNIKFGQFHSDHMFEAEFSEGAWKNFKIIPFDDITVSPACTTLHYGQTIFEGLKAYKNKKNKISVFRMDKNAKRFNISAERMCMPTFPEKYFTQAISELLIIDKKWIPNTKNTSLYIRPLMIALDPFIGIKPAENFKFYIFTCPAGNYYSEPVKVKIETEFTRAIKGGVGYSKTAANYAAALYPAVQAQKEGFHQLIWTDGKEHNFVEESGTMNLFFVINNKLITPPLGDTVLDGVTRDSIISVCPELDIDVEIRKVSVKEIIDSLDNGSMTEAFGAGTAATIAPIKTIAFQSKKYNLPENNKISFSKKILDYLNNLKFGKIDDKFDWVNKL